MTALEFVCRKDNPPNILRLETLCTYFCTEPLVVLSRRMIHPMENPS